MKNCWKPLLPLLLSACLPAAAGGCQSSPLKTEMSKADQAKFREKVARDPFPAAQPNGFGEN